MKKRIFCLFCLLHFLVQKELGVVEGNQLIQPRKEVIIPYQSIEKKSPKELGKQLIQAHKKKNTTEFRSLVNRALHLYKNDKESFAQFLDARDEDNLTVLMRSAMFDDPEIMMYLLNMLEKNFGNDPSFIINILNARDQFKRTALWFAAQTRHRDNVLYLLEKGADLLKNNKKAFNEFISVSETRHGWTILSSLVYDASSESVKRLVQKAAKILGKKSKEFDQFLNVLDNDNNTVLTYSILPNDTILLKSYGAKEFREPTKREALAEKLGRGLIKATDQKQLTLFKQLLNEGSNRFQDNPLLFYNFVATRSEGGWNALMDAAADGQYDFVIAFIDALEKFYKNNLGTVALIIDEVDLKGRTALQLALERRHYKIAELIIDKMLEYVRKGFVKRHRFAQFITSADQLNGFTPLHTAVYNSTELGEFYPIVKKLIEAAKEIYKKDDRVFSLIINARDFSDRTPLSYVVYGPGKKLFKYYGGHE